MFLSTLDTEQKQAFLGLAHKFIAADGQLAPQEKVMLGAMKAEMGLPVDAEVPVTDLSKLLQPFNSKAAKATALLEIIGLGYSDNEFHSEESAFVKHMAEGFKVSEDEILQMESWVVRQIMLTREVTHFFQQ